MIGVGDQEDQGDQGDQGNVREDADARVTQALLALDMGDLRTAIFAQIVKTLRRAPLLGKVGRLCHRHRSPP